MNEKMKTEITAVAVYFNMWFWLGWYDIKQVYRRSFIGPFWITLSTGVMVGSIGMMFAVIFKSSISEFLPYFAIGQIVWLFLSNQINDACTTFIQYQSIIKQMSVPLTVHIMRTLWNNLILIGHNTLIIIVVLLIFRHGVSWVSLYAIPGFLLIVILLFLVSVMLGIICTRFRDITQIVAVFMQLIYFFTPIIWMKNVLPGKHSWVMDFNPFYHMVEIIRGPLLGTVPAPVHWLYMLLYIAVAAVLFMVIVTKLKHRVSYWL